MTQQEKNEVLEGYVIGEYLRLQGINTIDTPEGFRQFMSEVENAGKLAENVIKLLEILQKI